MLTCWRLGRNIPGRCIDHRRSPCPHTLVITGGHLVSTHWWGMTQSSASIYSGEGSSIFTSRLYNEILGTQYILVAGDKKTLYVEMQDALIQSGEFVTFFKVLCYVYPHSKVNSNSNCSSLFHFSRPSCSTKKSTLCTGTHIQIIWEIHWKKWWPQVSLLM